MQCSSFTEYLKILKSGSSGERITGSYVFDSFRMAELIESSVFLDIVYIPLCVFVSLHLHYIGNLTYAMKRFLFILI